MMRRKRKPGERLSSCRPRSGRSGFSLFVPAPLGDRAAACSRPVPKVRRARCPGREELGYLDDEAFARGWIDARVRLKPMGARRLALELRRKGVSQETAKGD